MLHKIRDRPWSSRHWSGNMGRTRRKSREGQERIRLHGTVDLVRSLSPRTSALPIGHKKTITAVDK